MFNQRFQYLEVLRALCALTVFIGHLYSKSAGFPQHPIANMLLAFGTESVICFFVLSGCVISLQRYSSAFQYVKARAIRIVPIYYVALVATALIMIYCNQPVPGDQFIKNAFFLQTMQGHIAAPLAFNLPTWSLSYEMIYYAIFPALLYVPRLYWPLFLLSIGTGITLYVYPIPSGELGFAQVVFSFFCCWLVGVGVVRALQRGRCASLETGAFLFVVGAVLSRVSLSSDYYDFARLFCFAIGSGALCSALLGSEYLSHDKARFSVITWNMGFAERAFTCACALAAFWLISRSLVSTKIFFTCVAVLTAIAPSALVRLARYLLKPIKNWLIYVGGLSYALYIIHYPFIYFANNALGEVGPVERVMLTGALAFGSAHFLEYWFQNRIKGLIRTV